MVVTGYVNVKQYIQKNAVGLSNISISSPPCNIMACNINIANIFSNQQYCMYNTCFRSITAVIIIMSYISTCYIAVVYIARPWPTSACVLTLTFQALPSPAQQESCDSIMEWARQQMHYSSCNVSISIYMKHIVNLSINTLQLAKSLGTLVPNSRD